MEAELIRCAYHRDVFTGLYYCVALTQGRYNQLYGQGRTKDEALSGLKIRVNQINRR